jgi:hypothetical protein
MCHGAGHPDSAQAARDEFLRSLAWRASGRKAATTACSSSMERAGCSAPVCIVHPPQLAHDIVDRTRLATGQRISAFSLDDDGDSRDAYHSADYNRSCYVRPTLNQVEVERGELVERGDDGEVAVGRGQVARSHLPLGGGCE